MPHVGRRGCLRSRVAELRQLCLISVSAGSSTYGLCYITTRRSQRRSSVPAPRRHLPSHASDRAPVRLPRHTQLLMIRKMRHTGLQGQNTLSLFACSTVRLRRPGSSSSDDSYSLRSQISNNNRSTRDTEQRTPSSSSSSRFFIAMIEHALGTFKVYRGMTSSHVACWSI